MGRKLKAVMVICILLLVVGTATGCGNQETSSTPSGTLTFSIWDTGQQPGMEKIVEAYKKVNPNVNIEVQVTGWDQYWTKLEAGITSHKAPDIFWMHSTYILDYADAGVLADVGDLFDPANFPESALLCCQGSDGKYYALPKDKDTVGLVYSKKLFDEAGVAYPTADWSWTELDNVSGEIYDKTGKYGFLAYYDEQIGYWPFVMQAGGFIINDDRTEAGFTDPGTEMGFKYYVDLQKNDWCPDQNYFAANSPSSTFYSGNGAMFLDGCWNMRPNLENYPEMVNDWDVQVLPKCPTPVKGDGRATVSNSLGYATTADCPNLEAAKDFIKFCGTKEAQEIQGTTGTAIPAYNGLEESWVNYFKENGYKQDFQAFIDMFSYAQPLPNDPSRPSWKIPVQSKALQIYNGDLGYEEGLAEMQSLVDQAMKGY